MDNLIYNRTTATFFNAEDLNRIEEWTQMLTSYLDSLGYSVVVKTRRWQQSDIPWQDEIDRIRTNIKKLYDGYHYLPDWKEITFTNSLDFTQANVLEWDLNAIYTWLNRMVSIFWHSAEFYSGEGGIA